MKVKYLARKVGNVNQHWTKSSVYQAERGLTWGRHATWATQLFLKFSDNFKNFFVRLTVAYNSLMISWRPIGLWKQTWWSTEAEDKLTILQPRQSSTMRLMRVQNFKHLCQRVTEWVDGII